MSRTPAIIRRHGPDSTDARGSPDCVSRGDRGGAPTGGAATAGGADGTRPVRGGSRCELLLEGAEAAAGRGGDGDAAGDDFPEMADRAGSRAAALDPLAHRRPAARGEE